MLVSSLCNRKKKEKRRQSLTKEKCLLLTGIPASKRDHNPAISEKDSNGNDAEGEHFEIFFQHWWCAALISN